MCRYGKCQDHIGQYIKDHGKAEVSQCGGIIIIGQRMLSCF